MNKELIQLMADAIDKATKVIGVMQETMAPAAGYLDGEKLSKSIKMVGEYVEMTKGIEKLVSDEFTRE